jgi:DNA mismatch repair protein MutL
VARIRRLPADLANQIAAGEVVERPASVVKELVENAIDAGATKVVVAIEQGGVAMVRVTDDGEGMDAEDARLALERHATSKIARIEDLSAIGTFGSRGEALPSIASVSRLSLVTRRRDADAATEVRVDGGGEPQERPAGAAPGTTVEVRDLFFNVPARLKFLKSTATESAHVSEVVLWAALARPELTFVLYRDGRTAREYLRAGSRRERAAQAFPDERLEPCLASRGPIHVEAYLGAPERARTGAVALHLFVNGRPVRDRALARAVAQAYGSVLDPGRYPVGVVHVDLPPELVDVNVHPQKAEVRFENARAIHDAVTRELFGVLGRAYAIPALGPPSRPWQAQHPLPLRAPAPEPSLGHAWPPALEARPQTELPVAEQARPFGEPAPERASGERGFYARLRYVGQARGTYLLCEGEDGVYVLDQHAADERVSFDRLRRAYAARAVAVQRLLVPELVELAPQEAALLAEHEDAIGELGLELRAAGASTVAVHGVPRILARATPERLVRDLLAELGRAGGRGFSGAVDLALATMACHGSVRAGDALSREQAEALLSNLDGVDFSGHCPHGRPVVTRLGFDELERKVGR